MLQIYLKKKKPRYFSANTIPFYCFTVLTSFSCASFCVPTEQGSLTIVRRSSTKKNPPGKYIHRGTSVTIADDEALDEVDLNTDNLPAVDTPDACDKAALR